MTNQTLERNASMRQHDSIPNNSTPELTEREADLFAEWFRALSDPTRIRILNLLAQNSEPLCVCEIVDHFPIGQSSISHHLKLLRDVRFVIAERRGTFIYYRINHACLKAFPETVNKIFGVITVDQLS